MAKTKKKKRFKKKPIKKISRRKAKLKKKSRPKRKTTLTKKRKSVKKTKPGRKAVRKKPSKKRKSTRKKATPKRKTVKRKPKKRTANKKRTPKKTSKKRRVIKRKPKKTYRKKKTARRAKKKPARRNKRIKKKTRSYPQKGSLEQLFESGPKVRIMKLFFRNPEESFLFKDAAKLMKMNLDTARKEMKKLEKIGLLRSRKISPRKQLFSIDHNFNFFNELRKLILKASPVSKESLLKTIRKLGRIKLVLISGIFIGNDTPKTNRGTVRTDLLIVGDGIRSGRVNRFIKNIEAEAGTNINCAIMTTKDFKYRYNMYDRFVRDLIDGKSEFLMNKLKF